MRMRIAQIQGVTVAEEMGRTRTLGACWSDTWKVDIEGGYHCTTLNTNSVLLSEHDWTEHVDNGIRTQSRIPHYIVGMTSLASVECGSFTEFLCFDDHDSVEEYPSVIFFQCRVAVSASCVKNINHDLSKIRPT
ncbi:uncharacterized protein LOC144308451 isoform X2 [Canis aureus]